jgi:hypothetical protein
LLHIDCFRATRVAWIHLDGDWFLRNLANLESIIKEGPNVNLLSAWSTRWNINVDRALSWEAQSRWIEPIN